MSTRPALPRLFALSFTALLTCVLLVAAGCSDDPVGAGDNDCPPGERYHPIEETCVVDRDDEPPPNTSPGDPDAGHDADDPSDADTGTDTDAGDDCEGIECDQASCSPGDSTTISGTVTIPSGDLPLPDVTVYVPYADTVGDVPDGATCQRCEDQLSGTPLTSDTTDGAGHFEIDDVPVLDEVPVVVEVGKWRRQFVVDDIQACQNHPVDNEQTRLPANSDEGHLPQIAMTTGGWDAMECLVRKIGVDDQEFTTERDDDADGAVHLFSGVGGTDRFDDDLNDGASFTDAWDWWDELDNLLDYDIVVHSCEGSANSEYKSNQARQALQQFTHAGGRVFLSHWHNIWLDDGPDGFDDVADWTGSGLTNDSTTGFLDTSFPKGEQFEEWMVDTGTTPAGEFDIEEARATVGDIDDELAQRWVYLIEEDPFFGTELHPQYFSFNTPVDVPETQQCGRVVFSDIHVAANEDSSPSNPFPTGCTDQEMTDQEKALVFMFFDLSRCIIDDGKKDPSQ